MSRKPAVCGEYHASNIGQRSHVMRERYSIILLLLSTVFVASCGFLKKDKPEAPTVKTPLSQIPFETQLIVSATPDINPDIDGRPSPVRVRFFLSEAGVDLTTEPFEAIFEFGGADLTEKPVATIVLKPDTMRVVPVKGMRSQSTLSVAAAFRDPFSVQWIESRTIDTIGDGNIRITVNANGIEFE